MRVASALSIPYQTLVLLLVVALSSRRCHAITPTVEMDVEVGRKSRNLSKYSLLASQAFFGGVLPMRGLETEAPVWRLVRSPADNVDLCTQPRVSADNKEGTIMLVPRGTCTFERKAYHAQLLGANAVIVYGSLEGHYSLNMSTSASGLPSEKDIVWPVSLDDYDCKKGRAVIPKEAIQLDPFPYNAGHNNPLLAGNTSDNLCIQNSADSLASCPSKACLLTGVRTSDKKDYEACCAWDLYIWLYADLSAFHSVNTTREMHVDIPAMYVTLQEGAQLIQDLQLGTVTVAAYERWRPAYNPSSAMIWLLAVAVAAIAAHLSAADYHAKRENVLLAKTRGDRGDTSEGREQQGQPQQSSSQLAQPEETLELNAYHAMGFLVMASTSLLVLFYFKIFGFVKVMYAFGCSKAVSAVLFTPLLSKAMKHFSIPNTALWRIEWEDIGEIYLVDVLAHVIGYSLGLTWLIIAFAHYHPETITFFWVMQDIFGACMCVLFLQVVKLNNIRVAVILLVIAFFYDIFFVFITPLIFKKSVMLDVATSGGPPPDPAWCEKYPDDPENCRQRGNPLPMLFTIPRIGDYQGGQNLLGLGDVVVPGLLISFAARFDAAKSLLGVMNGGNGSVSSYSCPEQRVCGSVCCNGGYFIPVVIAYAVGLLMANAAVYLMEMGQPALLYLVPCCLGMVLFIGWRRRELSDLWVGPRCIKSADIICYGEDYASRSGSQSHAPLPQNGEGEMQAISVPSALDDDQ